MILYSLVIVFVLQLLFEGVIGSGVYGDMAIDDVKVTKTQCAYRPAQANPNFGSTTATPSTVNTVSTMKPTSGE